MRMQSQYPDNSQPAMGILQHLDTAGLQKLLADEASLNQLVKDNEQVKEIDVKRETLLAENKSYAEFNLAKEPKLTQAKHQLAAAYDAAVTLQKQAEQNKQKLDAFGSQNSLDVILALLQTETAKSEELSERTATAFVGGKISVDDFISQYSEQRKVVHVRRVKADKMVEVMRRVEVKPYTHSSCLPPEPSTNYWLM